MESIDDYLKFRAYPKPEKTAKSIRFIKPVTKHYFLSGRKRTIIMNIWRFRKRMSEKGRATLYRDPNDSPVAPILVSVRVKGGGRVYHWYEDHLQAWTFVDKVNNNG